jgi:hypothetical protein
VGQRLQHAECEAARAAEIAARSDVGGGNGLTRNEFANAFVVIVVDDDELVGRGSDW